MLGTNWQEEDSRRKIKMRSHCGCLRMPELLSALPGPMVSSNEKRARLEPPYRRTSTPDPCRAGERLRAAELEEFCKCFLPTSRLALGQAGGLTC